MAAAVAAAGLHPDTDTDPRELEAFAERFKQRRIKLGKDITQYASNKLNPAPGSMHRLTLPGISSEICAGPEGLIFAFPKIDPFCLFPLPPLLKG